MRARGYKEVRYWVPDVSSPEFARRIRDEAVALNRADADDATAEFLEDVQAETVNGQ